MRNAALQLLQRALANPAADFRTGQWECIEGILRSQRQLVVQKTGWGKSMVYFLGTRLLRDQGKGLTLLVSPLLSLMRNQIMAANRLGILAETINSSNTDDWQAIEGRLLANKVDILLISPERLANDDFRERVLQQVANRVGLFVVDEAHCISDWGHDFRPDYRRIVGVLQALPKNIPILATTATANDRVVRDVAHQLGALNVVRGPLIRETLALQNIWLPNPPARMAWLAEHLKNLPGSGIIYTLTVRDSERVTEWLKANGYNVEAYHSKIDSEAEEQGAENEKHRREQLEHRLLNNEVKALVATVALGMGFDKPDLGFVVHFQRPGSVVHYYQQVGRAGRAVDYAYGILMGGEEDKEMSLWGDAGWGHMVREDKYKGGKFRDELTDGCLQMLEAWQPAPPPVWMTCIPSLTHPDLVPDFARRLAARIGIPFVPCLKKVRQNEQQKRMQNSFQQAKNLDGVFEVDQTGMLVGPVLLVDDMVDSRWTFTVAAALLRQAGCPAVLPLALALNSPRTD